MSSVEIGVGGGGPAGGGDGAPDAGCIPARTTAMQAIGTDALLSEESSAFQKAAAESVSSARLDSSRASAIAPVPPGSGGATPKASHICLTESLLNNLTSAYRAVVASDAAAGGRQICPTFRRW